MRSRHVFSPTPMKHLKPAFVDPDLDLEPAPKRIRLSPCPLPTPPLSTQVRHPKPSSSLFNSPFDSPTGRQKLQSSLLRPLQSRHRSQSFDETRLAVDPHLSAWLTALPCPNPNSCPVSLRTSPLPAYPFWNERVEPQRPKSCPVPSNLVRIQRPASGANVLKSAKSEPGRTRLTFKALQKMGQPPSQHVQSSGCRSSKPATTSEVHYIDTLFGHKIVIDFSGRKIPGSLQPLKAQILKRRNSPQLEDKEVDKVIDTAEEIAYSAEGPTYQMLGTPMFPLDYGKLHQGGRTKWNPIALPNNPNCTCRLSAPHPDVYLAYPPGSKSPWTVAQNEVVGHPNLLPYSHAAKRHTFPSMLIEVKAESTGGTLNVAEAQAAGGGSHCVNAVLWLLNQAKKEGLGGVDLMRDTVAFSIVVTHRLAVVYLHWFDPEAKEFNMSQLKSYLSTEPDHIRACNNCIKNIIDEAKGARKTKLGQAFDALKSAIASWNSQPAAIDDGSISRLGDRVDASLVTSRGSDGS